MELLDTAPQCNHPAVPITLEWALPDDIHGQGSVLSKDLVFRRAIGEPNVICKSPSFIKDQHGIFTSRLKICEHRWLGCCRSQWMREDICRRFLQTRVDTGLRTAMPFGTAEPALLYL